MGTRSQQPRRGMTEVASRGNGWDNGVEGMRAVGTRPSGGVSRPRVMKYLDKCLAENRTALSIWPTGPKF